MWAGRPWIKSINLSFDKHKTQFSKTHWHAGKLRILWFWAQFSSIYAFFRLPKHKDVKFRSPFSSYFPFSCVFWATKHFNYHGWKLYKEPKSGKKKKHDDIWGNYWIEKIVPLTTILGFPDSPSFLLWSSCRWKILAFFRWKKKRVWSFSLIVRRSLHFYVIVSFPIHFFTSSPKNLQNAPSSFFKYTSVSFLLKHSLLWNTIDYILSF